MDSFVLSFAAMLAALAFVVGLAWLMLRLLRDRMQPRASGAAGAGDDAIRFVRALPVGTKERVVVVEHRGERWMLGVTAGGITTIAHWPSRDGAAAPAGLPASPATSTPPSSPASSPAP